LEERFLMKLKNKHKKREAKTSLSKKNS